MQKKQSLDSGFNSALQAEKPLQIVGVINAYSALLAKRAGFKALYLSGAGVANASFGLPDLAMTSLPEVCEDIRRITSRVDLPLLVDADTGWGNAFMIARSVAQIEKAGAAALHIEDQVQSKRCGHRPGKSLVSLQEMCDRVKAAVDGRRSSGFVIMARTDALAVESMDAAIERSLAYVEAGADMIFAEALTRIEHYQQFTSAVKVPVLANLTEFGKTPLFSVEQLSDVGIAMLLYPLSAFRAMNRAAETVYSTLREAGTQSTVVDQMQTREELYDVLEYHDYENKLDELFEKNNR